MADIITIGDSSIDLYMSIEGENVVEETDHDRPKMCFYHGSKIPVDHFETSVAGNALNVASGCAFLGVKSAVYTEIGDDQNADKIISEASERGVDTQYVVKNKGTSTDVHTVIIYRGERTIFSYHGKRDYSIKNWETPKWIYYSSMAMGFEKFQEELIGYMNKNKVGLAFNPGTMHMRTGLNSFKNVLKVTDILFVNKEEAMILCGISENEIENTGDQELHKKLRGLGPKLTAITNGDGGASAYDGTNFETQKIYSDPRPVKDKTGAGDAFSSGFMSAIIYGKNLKESLKWGAINSGNEIKEIGAVKGLIDKDTIEKISKTFT